MDHYRLDPQEKPLLQLEERRMERLCLKHRGACFKDHLLQKILVELQREQRLWISLGHGYQTRSHKKKTNVTPKRKMQLCQVSQLILSDTCHKLHQFLAQLRPPRREQEILEPLSRPSLTTRLQTLPYCATGRLIQLQRLTQHELL